MANILSSITLPDNNRYDFKALSIPFAKVDTTSTSTKFTATIPGIEEYYDGLTVMLYNGKVTSASGYTININGLGAYGTYSNMALGNSVTPTDPTRDTTIFNINYAMIFVFYTNIGGDGVNGWICYRGYDTNTNTIGYQVRSNSSSLPMTSVVYRYRLLFTSADGAHFVPANNSTSTNATSSRSVCQDPIDPFGRIVYYGTTASVAAGSRPGAASLWELYTLTFGYSFQTSPNYSLTAWKPIYIKCAPQTNGSAIIDSTTPFVQNLPSTEDGKIYIFLGVAYSTTNVELYADHPVYYYKDGAIRLWTNAAATSVTETDPVFSASAASGITSSDISAWNAKSDFSGSYNDLTNKPTIPTVPTNVSAFTNDAGYLTSYTETDPTVPAWAKASSKPTYTASEVGALPSTTVIPSKTSDLTNDSGYITGITSSDVTTALGYTPYNSTNPSGYTSDEALTDSEVEDAVDDAFATVYYNIGNPSNIYVYDSFDTSTGSHGSAITQAEEGTIIYVSIESSNSSITITVLSTNQTETVSNTVYTGNLTKVFSYTMPASSISIVANNAGSGDDIIK